MIALAVVKKHMFANDKEPMLHSILLFGSRAECGEWVLANPVDEYTRIRNGFQYERVTPKLVGSGK